VKRSSFLVLSILLVALIAGCQGQPPGNGSTGAAAPKAPAAHPATPATVAGSAESKPRTEAAETATAIPDTEGDLWKAIDAKRSELAAVATNGDLSQAHHLAYAIRDLVAALPAKSSSLSADDQAKLRNNVKFVATLAERLDASGDAGDRAATQANYEKLAALLTAMKTAK
jgi:hypothetical protein